MQRERTVRTNPWLVFSAPARVVVCPASTFSTDRPPHPVLLLTLIVVLATVAGTVAIPIVEHILMTTPEIGVSRRVARTLALFQLLILTPAGTAIGLVSAAALVWFTASLSGHWIPMRSCSHVVFLAGSVSILERLFVTTVLYLRWWFSRSTLDHDIATGIDAYLDTRG